MIRPGFGPALRPALCLALLLAGGGATAQSTEEARAGVTFTRHATDITLTSGARKTLRSIRENHLFTVAFNKSPAYHTAIFNNPATGRFFYSGGKAPIDTAIGWARKSCVGSAGDPADCRLFATITPRRN